MEKICEKEFLLARADLYERVGSIYVELKDEALAKDFFTQAYLVTEKELSKNPSDSTLYTMALVMDKLGTISKTIEEKKICYSSMYEIQLSLARENKDEKSLDGLAYAMYKLALADENNPERELLERACIIWKELYENTDNAEYARWYRIAYKHLG